MAALPSELYEITNGPARSLAVLRQPDCFEMAYRPKGSISKHFGAIMGDAVNNLRESLDYWMNNAIKCVGVSKKVHFPFSAERKDLETSPFYPAIQRAFPNAAAFISADIEPCRDTNIHLWAATSLCNENKHNDFLPCATVGIVQNITGRAGRLTIEGANISGNADKPIKLIGSDQPIAVQDKYSLALEITFPKGAVFENQPVVPTLTKMAEVVSQTLDALETFIRPHCRA